MLVFLSPLYTSNNYSPEYLLLFLTQGLKTQGVVCGKHGKRYCAI